MLPFLKPKKSSGVVGVVTKTDSGLEPDHSDEMTVALAEDLLSAIAMKDAKAVADSLTALFLSLDSKPHVEGEHE